MTNWAKRAVLLGVVATLLSGCVRYAVSVEPNEPLDPSKGYLYGRFRMDPSGSGGLNIGLVVASQDKKEQVALRFEQDDEPYAVAVKPGDYRMTHLVFSRGNEETSQEPMPAELADRVISVEAGKAYYLGDYAGEAKRTFLVLFTANEWRFRKAVNRYAGTTREIEKLVPQLKAVPKMDVFGDSLAKAFSQR